MKDIRLGDVITYKSKLDGKINILLMTSSEQANFYSTSKSFEILKIERPTYEVVEEKKELLTDEEREFLKQFIKLSDFYIDYIQKNGRVVDFLAIARGGYEQVGRIIVDNCYFKKLENEKMYSLSDLGLEE